MRPVLAEYRVDGYGFVDVNNEAGYLDVYELGPVDDPEQRPHVPARVALVMASRWFNGGSNTTEIHLSPDGCRQLINALADVAGVRVLLEG